MSQIPNVATRYNNGNAEARTTQLRNAKVEESQIQELSRTQFEKLPEPIQEKLNACRADIDMQLEGQPRELFLGSQCG